MITKKSTISSINYDRNRPITLNVIYLVGFKSLIATAQHGKLDQKSIHNLVLGGTSNDGAYPVGHTENSSRYCGFRMKQHERTKRSITKKTVILAGFPSMALFCRWSAQYKYVAVECKAPGGSLAQMGS